MHKQKYRVFSYKNIQIIAWDMQNFEFTYTYILKTVDFLNTKADL